MLAYNSSFCLAGLLSRRQDSHMSNQLTVTVLVWNSSVMFVAGDTHGDRFLSLEL